MTALTNFNNFELNTEETNNVNGGCRRRRRTSYSSCCSYSSCESVKTCDPIEVEETIVEQAPVIATPVLEAPTQVEQVRGVAGL